MKNSALIRGTVTSATACLECSRAREKLEEADRGGGRWGEREKEKRNGGGGRGVAAEEPSAGKRRDRFIKVMADYFNIPMAVCAPFVVSCQFNNPRPGRFFSRRSVIITRPDAARSVSSFDT